jgi:hypothetical protein
MNYSDVAIPHGAVKAAVTLTLIKGETVVATSMLAAPGLVFATLVLPQLIKLF